MKTITRRESLKLLGAFAALASVGGAMPPLARAAQIKPDAKSVLIVVEGAEPAIELRVDWGAILGVDGDEGPGGHLS